jgi:hypothetical protein
VTSATKVLPLAIEDGAVIVCEVSVLLENALLD